MKIQIVSDLHLEFGLIEIKNAGADVLILSGDIVVAADIDRPSTDNIIVESERSLRVKNFFEMVSREFKNVIYVMGNHEHYHGDINHSREKITNVLNQLNITNVHFLENSHVIIDDVVFVGGTLWTDCNKECPVTLFSLKSYMNDYRVIQNGKHRLLPEDTVEFYKNTKKIIEDVVQANGEKKVVVVGHHAPSKASTHPRYKKEIVMNGAYSSDLSEFILDNPNIKLWTHGHTHESFDYMIGTTRIVCNPRGYEGYETNPAFDPSKMIEV